MTPKEKECLEKVGKEFNRFYKRAIEDYVRAVRPPPGKTNEDWAYTVTARVAQFTLGRLVTELLSTGLTLEDLIKFLRVHAEP